MMATRDVTTFSFQYNYMNQYNDWSGTGLASPDSNSDKKIETSFYTLGVQSMFNREWGIMGELPIWNRYFATDTSASKLASTTETAIGDVRLMGMYTGFSEDMSTALMFGVKLPTGSFTHDPEVMDRDTQIGTGTLDGLLGGYRMGQESGWGWFGQFMWIHAFNQRAGYRPGDGLDLTVAAHYDKLMADYNVVPMVQFVGSYRGADSGVQADPDDSGYKRLYIVPGMEMDLAGRTRLYADVRIPLYVNVRGYQLVAPYLVNLTLSLSV
jgi:hypothetical protein